MNLTTFVLAYLLGVSILAIIIRYINAKEKSQDSCFPPILSVLSWIGVAWCIVYVLGESCENGFIAKLLNYTNKE
jgi:hypothetical protein